jgi:hypothetical protein
VSIRPALNDTQLFAAEVVVVAPAAVVVVPGDVVVEVLCVVPVVGGTYGLVVKL